MEAAASTGSGQASDDAKRSQAIALLEQILKDRQMNTATPEADIDLARLYVQAKRFDDAEKTLKFVIAFLGDKRTLIRMELPDEAMVQPYVKAAKAALARLKYERDAGREEFEAAEKLRKQEKWLPAARAHQAIVKDFAETDYAPRSELHVGDCLLGLGRESQAVAHWKKFIEPQPAGPWRAQAYIKIIDYCLEQQLDLPEAGKYAELARSSLPTALADEKAGESWQAAAFDVQLRVGLVSFCENKSAVAAEAFEAAKQLTSNKTTAERLDALIAAAKSGKGVIPDDVKGPGSAAAATASPSDKVALALSMGVIHLVAGRLDNADAFFCRVAGDPASKDARSRRPMPGATPAQRAFATFGRGAVLHAHRKESEAKEAFLASIKAFGDGSWHDETLYRVATITQDLASAKFAKAPEPANPSAKPLTAKERAAKEKAEEERLAALLKAKGEALPYWQELITRYPKSPRVEQAMYNAGVLLCELAEAAPAARAEKAWKDAAFMLNRFCEFYPKSPLAGDAYVRQVDIAMEQMFDLDLAQKLSDTAIEWANAAEGNLKGSRVSQPEAAWAMPSNPLSEDCVENATLALVGRSAFILFVSGQQEGAKELLERLRILLNSRPNGEWDNYARLKWGFEHGYLYAYPNDLDTFAGNQRLAVLLADFHYVTMNFHRTVTITEYLLAGKCGRLLPQQSAYVLFLNGSALCWLGQKQAGLARFRAAFGAVTPACKNVSLTQERAMYAAARVAISLPDNENRTWGLDLLRQLAACDRVNEFTGKAKIAYAVMLLEQGKADEGTSVLQKLSQTDSTFGPAAEAYLRAYRQGNELQRQ